MVRVELEAAPDDVDVPGVRRCHHGALEPPLADVAPRADDVRPDLHVHRSGSGGPSADVSAGRQVSSTQARSSSPAIRTRVGFASASMGSATPATSLLTQPRYTKPSRVAVGLP